ncbi:MAG: histidinol-phosphatase HisJ family protein [Phycisphaerales bacterium]|nr:histidinol-phosphatase HisJ family protein [Phycisphaerales bacterium]MCI0632270.1 histidinol-phosphatase HisJ family protein [Phycisphaerales bacterium]MCI0674537.1 histidinol-phosphatase HisJ family protein [Phycisphaerales bacterium]
MLATYHNHSTWSDGKASVAELLAAARRMNIAELGISDHWVLHPTGKQFKWAMPTDRLADYVADLVAQRDDSADQGGPALRIGLEVDWFPGHGEALQTALGKHNFDYLIGSVHQIQLSDLPAGEFVIDTSAASWQKLTESQRNQIHRQYWINMNSLAQSGLFDIIAHIDLPKKFGFYPTIDLSQPVGDALDAIAAAQKTATSGGGNSIVELNTAGWHKPCNDAYPTLDILRECRRRNINVTLSADAHQPEHLLRDFLRGAERLGQAGYTHLARFHQRRVRFEPLTDAVPIERASNLG